MKKLILAVALSLSSAAFAQFVAPQEVFSFNDQGVGDTDAAVSQGIRIVLPITFGLHLHENQWNVDLDLLNDEGLNGNPTVSAGQNTCYRAGNHINADEASNTGYDQYYTASGTDALGTTTGNIASTNPQEFLNIVNASDWSGDGVVVAPYSYAGFIDWSTDEMTVSTGYPGFDGVVGAQGAVINWKGPLVCVNRKVLEVFSNNAGTAQGGIVGSAGMEVTATISAATTNFPRTFIAANVQGANGTNPITTFPAALFGNTTTNGTEVLLAERNGLSGGWRDLNILEGILLDGTEVGSNTPYTAVITYNLSAIDLAP